MNKEELFSQINQLVHQYIDEQLQNSKPESNTLIHQLDTDPVMVISKDSPMVNNISFYGSHNAAFAVEQNGKIVSVIEAERFLNYKNAGVAQYKAAYTRDFLIPHILNFVKKEYGITEFDTCYFQHTDCVHNGTFYNYHEMIPAKNYVSCKHHESHAAGTFYQSPYQEALIFSFDGGGNDGLFNVYIGNREKGIEQIARLDTDLGFPYMVFGAFLKDIKFEASLGDGNLVYPGKLMGLCAYGTVQQEWLPLFREYFFSRPTGTMGDYQFKLKAIEDLIGIKFDEQYRLEGQMAYDVAATAQKAFEEAFISLADPFLKQYPHLPICITGGCALNIILNTRLRMDMGLDVFIAPNPNDCGLAMGMLALHMKPKEPIDITYAGIPILDHYNLMSYVENYHAQYLKDDFSPFLADVLNGSVVGVVRGNAEHGARALGNRSILCNPAIPDMKDTLNNKVKHREWYRPFAPVCRLEDVNKYFEFNHESRFMSFCPKVREEWKDKLQSIVHIDGTARVQTVTKEQNAWLYDILTEFEKMSGVGVLLNTSFNVDGKPILSTYRDAMDVYQHTHMDRLLLDDFYFRVK